MSIYHRTHVLLKMITIFPSKCIPTNVFILLEHNIYTHKSGGEGGGGGGDPCSDSGDDDDCVAAAAVGWWGAAPLVLALGDL